MLERLQRQHSQRALTDLRKDRIAQLLEADVHQPRHAVGHGQPDSAEPQHHLGGGRIPGQRIDCGLVEKRRANGDQLGRQKQQQRDDNAAFDPRLIIRPEIGDDLAHGPHVA